MALSREEDPGSGPQMKRKEFVSQTCQRGERRTHGQVDGNKWVFVWKFYSHCLGKSNRQSSWKLGEKGDGMKSI